eukprot:CAMPEP_0168749610 /NCGR_PEP_ID=MMETSP0724-20121128/16809_1 /TAXON_ID=265536 /ORGANISM="Amphiprora sp., Strain CCMP467" /LENGTH=667 /DNA_ID=CAMNT_0008797533 /DNA_START=153 /DNA_END=2153 /DNA_ORIENTATION=+
MGGSRRKRGGGSGRAPTRNDRKNSDTTGSGDAATDEKISKENESLSNSNASGSFEASTSLSNDNSNKVNGKNESKPSTIRNYHKRGAKSKTPPNSAQKKETKPDDAQQVVVDVQNRGNESNEYNATPSPADEKKIGRNGVHITNICQEGNKRNETTELVNSDEPVQLSNDSNETTAEGSGRETSMTMEVDAVQEQTSKADAAFSTRNERDLRRASQGDMEAVTLIRDIFEKDAVSESRETEGSAQNQSDKPEKHCARRTSQGDMQALSPQRTVHPGRVQSTTNHERNLRRASRGEFQAPSPLRPGENASQQERSQPSMADNFSRVQKELSSIPETLPAIPSFRDGLYRKAGICDLGAWVKVALTLDGRDKITKVFQYSARFLAWWYLGTSQKHQGVRFDNLKKSLSAGRKAFRLGRTFIELQRMREMGLLDTLLWHWRRSVDGSDSNSEENCTGGTSLSKPPPNRKQNNPKTLLRRISTNIGVSYSYSADMVLDLMQQRPSMFRQVSQLSSRLYRMSTVGLNLGVEVDETQRPISHAILSAIKLLGLALYFTGDNMSYLSSIGLCDNFQIKDESRRLANRKRLTTMATKYGNRAYFVACLAGLVVSWRNYWDQMARANKRLAEEDDGSTSECDHDKTKEKQFTLFLSLVKSCCDVLVFSNNPGIDLW